MKIYTRTGDDGRTKLCAGPRVTKDSPHIEACGSVDELNAVIGAVRAEAVPEVVDSLLHRIQHELFSVGADLALHGSAANASGMIEDRHVIQLEQDIDEFEARLPPLTQFILPGGTRSAALLHVARTICRRAERRVVGLESHLPRGDSAGTIVRYLNRLSDLFFVLPRFVNKQAEISDEGWHGNET